MSPNGDEASRFLRRVESDARLRTVVQNRIVEAHALADRLGVRPDDHIGRLEVAQAVYAVRLDEHLDYHESQRRGLRAITHGITAAIAATIAALSTLRPWER